MRVSRADAFPWVIFCPDKDGPSRFKMTQREQHPLPLLCVGSCYIPLEGGHQATTSAGQKLVCAECTVGCPLGEESQQHLTVPLNFGLEMVASFPKSYLWLSEQKRSTTSSTATTSSSATKCVSPPTGTTTSGLPGHPLEHVTVYSLRDDVSVVQISDEHRHQPIEYTTCFTSRRHLEQAWRVGRSYLLAATLANRASLRQRVINTIHRKFARVAMHGVEFPFGQGPPDAGRNEDEDGLMEPPEVQQLAAELGMHNGPDGMGVDGGTRPPPDIVQFGATMLCGAISLATPIIQAISSTMDGLCGAIPVVDKLVLGESAPPRRAPIEKHSMYGLLEMADRQNSLASSHPLGEGLDKRLAKSALWMGISIQLVLSHYIASTMAKDTAAAVRSSGSSPPSVSPSAGRADGGVPIEAGKHSLPGKPIVMDVFSGLVTSLQANDFVREAVSSEKPGREGSVSAVELEQVLRQNNGVEIGFRRKDLAPMEELGSSATTVRGKGVILVGSLTDETETTRAIKGLGRVSSALPGVAVMNGSKFFARTTNTLGTLAFGRNQSEAQNKVEKSTESGAERGE